MDVNVLPSINKGSLLYFTLLYINPNRAYQAYFDV